MRPELRMGRAVLLLCAGLCLLSRLAEGQAFWESGCAFNRTHNYFFGRRTAYDRLLYTNRTARRASFFGRNTVDLDFPERGHYPRGVISFIEALDLWRDRGCAELRRGGPGFNFARVRLHSGWNRDLAFLVNVWGH